MADTVSTANLRAKVWSKKLWFEAMNEIYFKKFSSKLEPGSEEADKEAINSIIVIKEDLKKEKGSIITIPLAMKLSGAGITGDNTLEGSEEAMTFYDFSVTIDQLRNAVRMTGKMDEQKVAFNMRTGAKSGLKMWLKEKMDEEMFVALSASPTTNRVLYGGDADATNTIDSSDVMSTTLISKAKRKARLATPKIRPVIVDGKPYYICLLHDYQMKAIRAEDAWLQAQREGGVRGLENPIFSGAEGIWDGVVLHTHETVQTYATWGAQANLDGARALLLGAQAGVYAIGSLPDWVEKSFDYGNKQGFATGVIYEAAKTAFNSEDFGCIALDTYIAVD